MEKNKLFDQELLGLLSQMIDDNVQQRVFDTIFNSADEEQIIDKLIEVLEEIDNAED